jgi:hypothetical protein
MYPNIPTLPKPVRDMIAEVVAAMEAEILTDLQQIDPKFEQIHYLCAPEEEVIETLKEMSLTQKHQKKKYPLVVMLEDITIQTGRTNYYGTTSVEILLCTPTQKEYKSAQREAATFIPILRPMAAAFKKHLRLSPYFAWEGPQFPAIETDRKRLGRNGLWRREGNLFEDYIDAIHFENLELTLRSAQQAATRFRNF